ncbi:MAG: ribonuclease R [Lachnospiraceae bacterium]|nr:ribonuclease R [Lachnospiraceae bacterium]
MIYDLVSTKNYVPMNTKEIAVLLQIPKERRGELQEVMDSLEKDGKVKKIHRERYKKCQQEVEAKAGNNADKRQKREKNNERPQKDHSRETVSITVGENDKTVTGLFISHPKGFGFVQLEDPEQDDIFIPAPYVGEAFHHDQVEIIVEPEKNGKRAEGKVVRVLSHEIKEVVGTFERSKAFGFVVSDNTKITKDIFIPKEFFNGAKTGDKVVAHLQSYGGVNKKPEGRVTEVLGKLGDPGVDVLSVARSMDIPMEFPPKIVVQAERCPQEVLESDYEGRLDLREVQMITIDGEDAKDLDDAVSVDKDGELLRLGVHIADVSNYVQGNSALDKEALKRGTSVYLVDRVIPMLPKCLSNGICSLNEKQERLTLSCIMWVDAKGNVVKSQIAETVICSDHRMTYTNVAKLLEGRKKRVADRTDEEQALLKEYRDIMPMLLRMKKLSGILRKNRSKRGSIDFEFPESKIILNEAGKPVEIRAYEHNIATNLIEDFMLLANETVAKTYCEKEIPFLYRTHENPDMERMESVLTYIRSQGIKVQKSMEEITPGEVQKILSQIEGSTMEPLISRLLLRSMKQARYTTGCSGHFGLAAKYYCHFTSPIRRYPDLQIHRIIKDDLRGRMNDQKKEYYVSILDDVAQQTSAMERRAEEAERETDKMKIAEYMQQHIGDVYEGVISGVTGWGIYVELPDTVEGLVHVSTMKDDFYEFDMDHYQMVGEATKKTYRMGDAVKVRVTDADTVNKTIDFVLQND